MKYVNKNRYYISINIYTYYLYMVHTYKLELETRNDFFELSEKIRTEVTSILAGLGEKGIQNEDMKVETCS